MMNQYEKLFDELLDLVEFSLVKYSDNSWGLIDISEMNLGNIESERFSDADSLLERLTAYINDYIVDAIDGCLRELNVDVPETYDYAWYLDNAKVLLPESKWDFDVLDMVENHAAEIKLLNCTYTESEEKK